MHQSASSYGGVGMKALECQCKCFLYRCGNLFNFVYTPQRRKETQKPITYAFQSRPAGSNRPFDKNNFGNPLETLF
jgi:hypothetical protein